MRRRENRRMGVLNEQTNLIWNSDSYLQMQCALQHVRLLQGPYQAGGRDYA